MATIQLLGLLAALKLAHYASTTNKQQVDNQIEDLVIEPIRPATYAAWSNHSDFDQHQEPYNYGENKHWTDIVYGIAKYAAEDKVTSPFAVSPGDDRFFVISRRGEGNDTFIRYL